MVCSVSASASTAVTVAVNAFWSSRSELLAGTSGFQAFNPSNAAGPLQPRDPSLGMVIAIWELYGFKFGYLHKEYSSEKPLCGEKTLVREFTGWATVRFLASC